MRKILFLLFLCIAGAFLNIVLNSFAGKMFLPLYLDTVLTITVTLLGGPAWGSMTGALTNIIGHSLNFWGWEGYLFALCNIATAVITWLFMRWFPNELNLYRKAKEPAKYNFAKSRQLDNAMNRIFVLTLLGFVLCFAMSVLGGLIAFFIEILRASSFGGKLDYNPASVTPTMFQRDIPVILREILSRIPINIIDRLISAFAGFGIAWLIFFLNSSRREACALPK